MDEAINTVSPATGSGAAGGVWQQAVPAFASAVDSGDQRSLMDLLEQVSRDAAASESIPLADLLGAFLEQTDGLCAKLRVRATGDAARASSEVEAVQRAGLVRIAAAYSDGLLQTLATVRCVAQERSPLDALTGAMTPDAIAARLALEADRCQRMELPLGLVAVSPGVSPGVGSTGGSKAGLALRRMTECLSQNLRRYDSVGLTSEGDFVLVLPDISRRGLSGVVQRLRRELPVCSEQGCAPGLAFGVSHYDLSDTTAVEMLETVRAAVVEARGATDALAWS